VLAAEARMFSPDRPADVDEVFNYVRAMNFGLARLPEEPLSAGLLQSMHERLLAGVRGHNLSPGILRDHQNWIGPPGAGIEQATFVPPPPDHLPGAMVDLEDWIQASNGMPLLIRVGLAHVQFETIHPFRDGNGRMGRLLITLMLCNQDALRKPVLYLSHYFKQHRQNYYYLLDGVRQTGNWEAWLDFFLQGVAETAEGAELTAQRLLRMFSGNEGRIQQEVHAPASALRVHQALNEYPIASIQSIVGRTNLSFNAASSGMRNLEQLDIVKEVTGQRRNRVFVYQQYIDILSEGTEPL